MLYEVITLLALTPQKLLSRASRGLSSVAGLALVFVDQHAHALGRGVEDHRVEVDLVADGHLLGQVGRHLVLDEELRGLARAALHLDALGDLDLLQDLFRAEHLVRITSYNVCYTKLLRYLPLTRK